MVMVLDTDLLRPSERVDAIESAMQLSGIPAKVTHEPPPDQIYARINLWQLGGGTTMMHRDGSGVRLLRTPRQVRALAPDRISLTVLGPGRWTYSQGTYEARVESRSPQVLLTDQAAPYEFNRIGDGQTFALGIEHAALGLPIDQIRRAAERIEASPIFPLVRNHILQLSSDLDTIPRGPALAMVGNAATELVRALIVSATVDADRQHTTMTDSLEIRIELYLDERLHDPGLSPARIAHDHHISLRQLYNVWSKSHEQTIAAWIISRRLDAARRDLARPSASSQTISAVARHCGFVDTAHFARKFRQVYGMSPREWRVIARNDI